MSDTEQETDDDPESGFVFGLLEDGTDDEDETDESPANEQGEAS